MTLTRGDIYATALAYLQENDEVQQSECISNINAEI
jgi:hypothetical protein